MKMHKHAHETFLAISLTDVVSIYIIHLVQENITSLLAYFLHECPKHEHKYGQSDERYSAVYNE